jgi:membrane protein DedA with SNARE-associated domain
MTHAFPWPAQQIADWLPLGQAAGFFAATFILEDVATIGAGLLLATGAVTWPTAFAACFLGIWMGDAGLYAIARYGGRAWFERSSFRRHLNKVQRAETWFSTRGTSVLVFSRLIPGARLPTYLASGFLRIPPARFLLVTGIASFVWTLIVLFFVQLLGDRMLQWLGIFKQSTWAFAGIAVLSFAALQLIQRFGTSSRYDKLKTTICKYHRWEFWPAWLFYAPVAIYYVFLSLRYRSLTLPGSANPGIYLGGLVGESKITTLRDLATTSPEFTAQAEMIPRGNFLERLARLERIRHSHAIAYPFVLKPDIGQRGAGVKLIRNKEEAEACLKSITAPLVMQRYAAGPHEVGIFYYRLPRESEGHIFAITEKIFPVINGDGRSTIEQLITNDSRSKLIASTYLKRFAERRNDVLASGETLKLVEAGNHAQGCIFKDGMHLLTPALHKRIDEISQKLNGFFIGRYDLRYCDLGELQAGRNFQIVELNGASSEATSIYDPRHSLLSAYKKLFEQWRLVFAIGNFNRNEGIRTARIGELWHSWRSYSRLASSYPTAD